MSALHGGPAFPSQRDDVYPNDSERGMPKPGMSLRDYFAAKALQGFCANPAVFAANGVTGWSLVNCTDEQLVDYCGCLADAMLAERNKKGGAQ